MANSLFRSGVQDSLRCPTPSFVIRLAAQMSGTVDTLTASRKLEAADLSGLEVRLTVTLKRALWIQAAAIIVAISVIAIGLASLWNGP